MSNVIEYSQAKIYYPQEPKNRAAEVEHITLTAEQARAQGWHFRYKSGKRVRITRYTGTDADITIPAEIDGCRVNELGTYSFKNTNIISVNIPSTVKKLGKGCFFNCLQLEKAVFADGVDDLSDDTFIYCKMLKYVHLPRTLKRIGSQALLFCHALEHIEIPLRCRTVGKNAFYYSGLKSFAFYEPFARYSDFDGTALNLTPIFYDYELVMCRCSFPDEFFIMIVGRNLDRKPIRFPDDSLVMLGKNSVATNWCFLDLTACRRVDVSRAPFGNEESFSYHSVFVDFPKDNMPPTLPARVVSNFFDVKGFCTDVNHRQNPNVTRDNVQLVRHCIDVVSMRSIEFHSVWTCETEPVEVCSPNCYDLHEVSWEENGENYQKFTTPFEILHDNESVNKQLLKAFVIRKDNQTGQSIFYDRSVVDRLFSGKCGHILPNRHDKVLIAVDMLRSTPKPEEESTEMYRRFLLKNHHHAVKAAENLPEQWKEYKDFLAVFYETNSL